MAKFSSKEKIQAVKRYLEGPEGGTSIAKSIGVDQRVFYHWISRYEYSGEKAFEKRYTSYSTQFKLDVLNYMIENRTSIRETAAIFNIPSYETVRKWKVAYETEGLDALQLKEKRHPSMNNKNHKIVKKQLPVEGSIEELQEELERLRMENAYFKKVECLSSKQTEVTKKDKAQVVYELRHQFPVQSLLVLANIPRSTYYYWLKNAKRPDPDADLKVLIQAVYHEHEGRYGYRRIRDELTNRGHKINHKKIQRIMKELGLKCLVRMKKYRSYKGTVGKIAPNILERNFKAERPNEKWVTDITEFKLFGEKLYVSPMLDLFNGEIITYTIGSRPTYALVSNMLDQSFERLTDEDALLIHSDQGWHYQMKKYRDSLHKRGITQSMSRKGNCYDNAVIENFFGIMKSEFLYRKDFKNMEHFEQELAKYISYYNHKRIKAKLKGMSPIQYRTHAQNAA
ncbi:IS3 family transposase [Bacillus cereus group sp. IBL03679]|uniref:IS3 family transposase n=1 Tax=Bacillus cereus group sp. IBL03679 TaxID=3240095 RepID=UPI003D2F541D